MQKHLAGNFKTGKEERIFKFIMLANWDQMRNALILWYRLLKYYINTAHVDKREWNFFSPSMLINKDGILLSTLIIWIPNSDITMKYTRKTWRPSVKRLTQLVFKILASALGTT